MPILKSSIPAEEEQRWDGIIRMLKMAAFLYEEFTPKSKQTIDFERVSSRCEVDPLKDEAELLQYINENHRQRRQLAAGLEPFHFSVQASAISYMQGLPSGCVLWMHIRGNRFTVEVSKGGESLKSQRTVFLLFSYGILRKEGLPTVATDTRVIDPLEVQNYREVFRRLADLKIPPRPVFFDQVVKTLEQIPR